MKQYSFNKRTPLRFKHFSRKGYSLFAALGKEVLVGVLSISTLTYAKADGISVRPVLADDTLKHQEVKLEEVVVTGSRAPLTAQQSARMVTVLGQDDIAAAPVQSVNDLLKYAVGVDVRQRGPIGAQTDIGIRGGNYEQVAVLLNGINICDPQTGHNSFDLPIHTSEIERIEILEGPAGRAYGTTSLIGAINIITRIPTQSSITAHAESGSYGYLTGGLRANFSHGKWGNRLSGSYARSDGYSRNKAGTLNADYRGAKAFYQGSYSNDGLKLNWHAGLSTKDFGSNTFYGAKWDDQFEHTFKTFTALQAEVGSGKFHFRPAVYWNRHTDRFELFRGNPDAYPFNYHRTDVYGLNLNSYTDWAWGRTAIGVEMRNEDLVSGNLGEPLSRPRPVHGTNRSYEYGFNRTNISFIAEHNVLLKRFTLSTGLIATKNSWAEMNMRVYPGADVSYKIGRHFKLYASYNTSLRMPSVTELFYSVGGHKADKHLKPEELSALEGGVKYRAEGIDGHISVYYNHCRNLIDWIRDATKGPNADWQSVNFGTINSTGFEIKWRFNFARILPSQQLLRSIDVGYHYIDQSKNNEPGLQSRYVLEYLRHKVVANMRLHLYQRLNLMLSYRFVQRTGSYTDVNGTVQSYRPYSIADARLSWDHPRYKLYVEGNNVLNKTYVDVGNVPQPGAWIVAGGAINIHL
ncbi:MAG TPA: TonB-dependent receptor [Prevotella sp.]